MWKVSVGRSCFIRCFVIVISQTSRSKLVTVTVWIVTLVAYLLHYLRISIGINFYCKKVQRELDQKYDSLARPIDIRDPVSYETEPSITRSTYVDLTLAFVQQL